MTYVAAVIPTIDEADTIGDLVRSLDKVCDRVIVADGSDNGDTATEAFQAGAVPIDGLGGLGPAYKRAWGVVPTSRPWAVVHIDAGGSHDPADLYPMLELAEEGFDVVIGSRFCPLGEHHGKWRRRFTSKLASFALNWIYPSTTIHDWTSGYRVYSPKARAILAAHTFTTTGHAWQIEALSVLIAHGCRIVETPIIYRSSVSHLSAGRVKEAARLFWRMAWA